MRRVLLLVGAMALAAFTLPQVTVKAESGLKAGWMAGGWGSYRFTFENASETPAKIVQWQAEWTAKGKRVGDAWSDKMDLSVEKGKAATKDDVAYLPEEEAKASAPGPNLMRGKFTVVQGAKRYDVPFELSIPTAVLPEKLELRKGKTLGLELMESRWKTWKSADKALRWLDESYQAMIELTGYTPFDGKLMVIQEAPEHPYWAYAGNPVVMNTKFVPKQLEDIDNGLMPFGWVHEVGHNFDVYGDWYIWNGPCAEFQANFKLAYAFETIPDQTFRVAWGGFGTKSYLAPTKDATRTGKEFVDAFFLLHGDPYLADPKRTWDSMSSDEIHSFFQRLQIAYGWEPFKAWYRTYQRLAKAGMKPPESADDKINLVAAILSTETRVDLVPVFQRWRMPVRAEKVAELRSRYGLTGAIP